MKYYLIAGEASGDLHGSNLMKALKRSDREAQFRFFGGDKMKEAGENLVRHYREMAYMGLFDVVAHGWTIRQNLKLCRQDLIDYHPDCLILIDFAGFNLRIARQANDYGIPVFYYISPKVWAWNRSRVKKIRELVDRMFVILPFEVDFYRQYGYPVDFLGNPLVDAIEQFENKGHSLQDFLERNKLSDKPLIALLAGSRRQELRYCLPEMLRLIPEFPGFEFVIAGAPGLQREDYERYTQGHEIRILFDQTYELLHHARAAVVTSGTATLEAAMLQTPEVVVYRVSPATYHIGRLFVRITFFSLVNLIMEREVVRELLQYNLAPGMKQELHRILFDDDYRAAMMKDLAALKKKMGRGGVSDRVARKIVQYLSA